MKKPKKDPPPTIHISLGTEISTRLAGYIKNRNMDKSEAIRHSLVHLFNTEFPTKSEEEAVKLTLSKHFSVPKQLPYRAFFTFLYMLAESYPDANSTLFWGELVSVSKAGMSNRAIYNEIKAEINQLLAA